MHRLAVATNAETFERMQAPLAARDIEVGHVETAERTLPLDESPFDEYDIGFAIPGESWRERSPTMLDVPCVNDREATSAHETGRRTGTPRPCGRARSRDRHGVEPGE